MVNKSKDKGDRFERAFAAHIIQTYPELISVQKPMRHLGAGRKEDVGDMHLFSDAAIQVKAVAQPGTALRSAATGSVIQAGHAAVPFAVGVVPIFGARGNKPKWMATTTIDRWPGDLRSPVVEFGSVSKLMDWISIDEAPLGFRAWGRTERLAQLNGSETRLLVAPLEAWIEDYRRASTAPQTFIANGYTWSADEAA
jgi:hypothetical protein